MISNIQNSISTPILSTITAFDSPNIGSGSWFKRVTLIRKNDTEWKVDVLNIFQRIFHYFSGETKKTKNAFEKELTSLETINNKINITCTDENEIKKIKSAIQFILKIKPNKDDTFTLSNGKIITLEIEQTIDSKSIAVNNADCHMSLKNPKNNTSTTISPITEEHSISTEQNREPITETEVIKTEVDHIIKHDIANLSIQEYSPDTPTFLCCADEPTNNSQGEKELFPKSIDKSLLDTNNLHKFLDVNNLRKLLPPIKKQIDNTPDIAEKQRLRTDFVEFSNNFFIYFNEELGKNPPTEKREQFIKALDYYIETFNGIIICSITSRELQFLTTTLAPKLLNAINTALSINTENINLMAYYIINKIQFDTDLIRSIDKTTLGRFLKIFGIAIKKTTDNTRKQTLINKFHELIKNINFTEAQFSSAYVISRTFGSFTATIEGSTGKQQKELIDKFTELAANIKVNEEMLRSSIIIGNLFGVFNAVFSFTINLDDQKKLILSFIKIVEKISFTPSIISDLKTEDNINTLDNIKNALNRANDYKPNAIFTKILRQMESSPK